MKTYEKPRLIALSLNGNDRLCGDCTQADNHLQFDEDLAEQLLAFFHPNGIPSDGNLDGAFDELFDSSGACKYLVEGYCKFTGTTNLIAWS